MKKKIFTADWEKQLEKQLFQKHRRSWRAYICSPLSSKTTQGMLQNMHSARAYMYYAWKEMDYIARAPHAYLPVILNDRISRERTCALEFGRRLLLCSDIVLVCGKRLSEGMKIEIIIAAKHDIEIVVFNRQLCKTVKKLLANSDCRTNLVKYDDRHKFMSYQNPLKFIEGGESV